MGPDKYPPNIQALIDNGANHVRYLMIRAGAEQDIWTFAEYMEWIEQECEKIIADTLSPNQVICLVNPPGGIRFKTSTTWQRQLIRVWEVIATRLKGCSNIWGYEFLNEPVLTTDIWTNLVEKIVPIVRKIDGGKRGIVSSRYGSVENLMRLRPIRGITYFTCHIYSPMKYTHQGVYDPYPYPVSYIPGKATHDLRLVKRWRDTYKTRMYIGELAAARWAPECALWLKEVTDFLNNQKWHWAYTAWRTAHTWDLECPDTFCPDGSCLPPDRINTDRLEIIKNAWHA